MVIHEYDGSQHISGYQVLTGSHLSPGYYYTIGLDNGGSIITSVTDNSLVIMNFKSLGFRDMHRIVKDYCSFS